MITFLNMAAINHCKRDMKDGFGDFISLGEGGVAGYHSCIILTATCTAPQEQFRIKDRDEEFLFSSYVLLQEKQYKCMEVSFNR
ncbi:MAG: hypothetical protein LBS54_03775 [Dysgonamonadaceae bacterium]|nr:hypothetical protein [Dysgonamonadaceae bacterium]